MPAIKVASRNTRTGGSAQALSPSDAVLVVNVGPWAFRYLQTLLCEAPTAQQR